MKDPASDFFLKHHWNITSVSYTLFWKKKRRGERGFSEGEKWQGAENHGGFQEELCVRDGITSLHDNEGC